MIIIHGQKQEHIVCHPQWDYNYNDVTDNTNSGAILIIHNVVNQMQPLIS